MKQLKTLLRAGLVSILFTAVFMVPTVRKITYGDDVIPTALAQPLPSPSELVYGVFGEKLTPILMAIATCESGQKQWDSDRGVITSKTGDEGFFQISPTWKKTALELGIDYENSLEGNIKMAKIVYDKQGLSAWVCAKKLGLVSS